jgi:F-type H+-transporting ATPase subunit gamma
MGNLKEVRIRIESIRSTQQITSAMKLVAASKLRKTQNFILALRPYAAKLLEILSNLVSSIDNTDEEIYSKERETGRVLVLVLTSNRGLCGPFNSNIIKATKNYIESNYKDLLTTEKVDLFCIGKKGAEYFKKSNFNVVKVNNDIFDHLSFEAVVTMAEELMAAFASKKYDRIDIIYNRFKNAAVQILTTEQYLPILPPKPDEGQKKFQADYIFQPNKEELIRELIPKTLKIQLYKALLDSLASEHGARMTAMQLATDNANELLRDLRLSYNKARQAAITNQLVEIVSGAEALKG